MLECPDSIEKLEELEKLLPLCRKELLEQTQARLEAGTAKSERDAARQLAEEAGKSPEAVHKQILRERKKQSGTPVPKGADEELPLCTKCRHRGVYVHPKTGKPRSKTAVSYGLCGDCAGDLQRYGKWEKELAEGIENRIRRLNDELRYARPHLGEGGLTRHRDCFHEAIALRDILLEMFPLEDEE